MKKLIFIVSLFASFGLNAQSTLGLGTSFGLGTTQLNGDGIKNASSNLAWHVGANAQYQLGTYFAINSGAILQKKGGKNEGVERAGTIPQDYKYSESFNLIDVQVPIHLQVHLPLGKMKVLAYGGPDLNFNVLGLESRTYENNSYNDNNGYQNTAMTNLEVFNFGISYGLGLSAETSAGDEYFLKFGMSTGLNSVGKINNQEAKHQIAQVSLGYIFK